ncbi:MAG: hypothetical protein MI742_07285 [Desulfobacterales bacterium]|nr:hypothetical protein [Desulfobacterales bacterium]
MAKYKIPNGKSGSWGELEVKNGRNYVPKAEVAIGGALDFLIHACEVVEKQLDFEMEQKLSEPVQILLYLYFNISKDQSMSPKGKEAVSRIQSVIREVREGFLREQGAMLLKASDKGRVGMEMSGYVMKHILSGKMGHIHLELAKMLPTELSCGAPYFILLIFHEATHHFCKTVDTPVKPPGKPKTLAYANSTKEDVIAGFKSASDKRLFRQQYVGSLFDHIKPEEALNNADSFSWFLVHMIRSHEATLKRAKIPAVVWQNFNQSAQQFERVQKTVLPKEMVDIDGFVTFFKVAS